MSDTLSTPTVLLLIIVYNTKGFQPELYNMKLYIIPIVIGVPKERLVSNF